MDYKTFDCQLKADEGADAVGYFAVFGNLDKSGDVIQRGAFVNLPEFLKTGSILYNHDLGKVPIGYPVSAAQDSYGLRVGFNYHSTPEAQAARTSIRERLRAGLKVAASIGYKVLDQAYDYVNGQRVNVLKKLALFECSPVLIGANPEAGIISAKSGDGGRDLGKTPEFWAWLRAVAGSGPHEQNDVEMLFTIWRGGQESPGDNPYREGQRGQAWRSDVGPNVEGGNGMLPPGKSLMARLRAASERVNAALGKGDAAAWSAVVERHNCDPFLDARWRALALKSARNRIALPAVLAKLDELERQERRQEIEFRDRHPVITQEDYDIWRETHGVGGNVQFLP